jgi:hypothetical protein
MRASHGSACNTDSGEGSAAVWTGRRRRSPDRTSKSWMRERARGDEVSAGRKNAAVGAVQGNPPVRRCRAGGGSKRRRRRSAGRAPAGGAVPRPADARRRQPLYPSAQTSAGEPPRLVVPSPPLQACVSRAAPRARPAPPRTAPFRQPARQRCARRLVAPHACSSHPGCQLRQGQACGAACSRRLQGCASGRRGPSCCWPATAAGFCGWAPGLTALSVTSPTAAAIGESSGVGCDEARRIRRGLPSWRRRRIRRR